jgi:methanogenic corrinoid protein MtbC1
MLREIGVRWRAGTINPAQEHLVSGVIRGVLGALLRSMPRLPKVTRVVFATPEGDRHELGLLCGAVLAASHGYSVIYLGPDLPASDIAAAVRDADARILVLAGTVDGSTPESDRRALRRLAGRVTIWVGGGRADDLLAAIGSSARHVASLEELDRLWSRHAI